MCVMCHPLFLKPMFPGDDYIHQLQLISDTLGTPSDEELAFVTSDKAKRFMKSQVRRRWHARNEGRE